MKKPVAVVIRMHSPWFTHSLFPFMSAFPSYAPNAANTMTPWIREIVIMRRRRRSAGRVGGERGEGKTVDHGATAVASSEVRSSRSRATARGRVGRVAAHLALIDTDESDRCLRVGARGGPGENTEEGQLSVQTRFLHSRMRLRHTSDERRRSLSAKKINRMSWNVRV